MERTVPKGDKYAHIRGTLDTGLTIEKVKFITAREYSKRRDEIFFRINKNQLFELLNEYEVDEYESIAQTAHNALKIVSYSENAGPVYEKPYLILDVREIHNFNEYHVLQARSFPYQMLRRDQMHPEVYRFKNKPETLIIVCCDDEKISHECAKVLVDRGVDNVYLLTGGIHEFAYEYPTYIEGRAPVNPKAVTRAPRSSASKLVVVQIQPFFYVRSIIDEPSSCFILDNDRHTEPHPRRRPVHPAGLT
jgi:centrosomal protein CEP41